MQTEIELEAYLRASALKCFEDFQRVRPPGCDLRKCQIGASQLGTQGVDPHEVLRDLIVGKSSLKDVHPIHVLAYGAQAGQSTAVTLVIGIIEAVHTSLL